MPEIVDKNPTNQPEATTEKSQTNLDSASLSAINREAIQREQQETSIVIEASIDLGDAEYHPTLTDEQGLIVDTLTQLGLYDTSQPDQFGYTAIALKKEGVVRETGSYRRGPGGAPSDGVFINSIAPDGSIRDNQEYDLVHYLEMVQVDGKALIVVYDRDQLRPATGAEHADAPFRLKNPESGSSAVKAIISVSGI